MQPAIKRPQRHAQLACGSAATDRPSDSDRANFERVCVVSPLARAMLSR